MRLSNEEVAFRLQENKERYGDVRGQFETIRWRATEDLFWFASSFLGLGLGYDSASGKNRFDPVFHGWLCDVISRPGSSLVMIPRDHLKTTFVNLYLAQQVLKRMDAIKAAVFSSSATVAEGAISEVDAYLSLPRVLHYFGDKVPDPGSSYKSWKTHNKNALTPRRFPHLRPKPIKEEAVQGWGWGKRVAGLHFDLAVFDDIVDPDNASSDHLRNKVKTWVAYMKSVLDPHGKLLIIGTRYHFADLYQTVIEEDLVDYVVERTALEIPGEFGSGKPDELEDEKYKPIYSFYTRDMLVEIKRDRHGLTKSNVVFNSQYFMNPSPDSEKPFPPPQPTFKELSVGDRDDLEWYLTCDAAYGTKETNDQSGLCLAAMDRTGHLWCVKAWGVRRRYEEVSNIILDIMQEYPLRRIGIESNAFDMCKYILEAEKRKREQDNLTRIYMPEIHPIKVYTGRSKAERVAARLGGFVRSYRVTIQADQLELIKQMSDFPAGSYDDLVDALDMMVPLTSDNPSDQVEARPVSKLPDGHASQTLADILRARDLEYTDKANKWASQFNRRTSV